MTESSAATGPSPEPGSSRRSDSPAAPGSSRRSSSSRVSDSSRGSRRRERAAHSWRSGGSSVARWDWELVGWAVLLLGAGILLSTLADRLLGGTLGSALSLVALWGGMLAAIILAFVRSRPRMLLRFHPFDLLYGIVLGVLLRFTQGFLEIAGTGTAAWPTAGTLDGSLPASFWFDGVLAPVVIAPLLEEFFFRAVLLVAIFTAVRRMTNSRSWAGFAAITVTTLLFIGLHLVFDIYTWWSVATLGIVGLVCAGLVVATSRIWGAVLTHIVFNGVAVAMLLVGT
ncbi:MAG: CPBP family intramembrane metalloprotease [Actinobacteria bacterium]|nr:MAG: CPBP family intramembrane metalloprotease [Actinomycetota bacterium]